MKLKTLITLMALVACGWAQTAPQLASTVELMQTRGAVNTALAQIAAIACAGTPGNTTGAYGQQCQTGSGARYSCNNAAGCTVAADWVGTGGGSTRTWTYAYSGVYQSGVVGFAANLPATNAPSPTSVVGADPAAVLEWPCYTGGGCAATYSAAPYAWWSFTLPTGYTSNAAISYSIESRSTDSTHAAILTPSWGCVSTATVDAPTWTAVSTVNITGAAASGRVVTTGTITPTCAAGNRALIKFSINTNTNSMTGPFDLIGVTFSVQGGM